MTFYQLSQKYCVSTYFILVEYNPILVSDKSLDKLGS